MTSDRSGPSVRLTELLRKIESDRMTGTVRFESAVGGSLFFDQGRVYFATIDSRPLTAGELQAAGIDHHAWQEAGSRPGARGRFSEELIALGCPRDAIERFVLARVEGLIETIGEEFEIVQGNGRHGFGATISFPAGQFAPEPARHYADDLLVSLSRSDRATVTVDSEVWNALARLMPPMRFAELESQLGHEAATRLVEGLERTGLGDLVGGSIESAEPEAPEELPETHELVKPEGRLLFERPDPEDDEYVPDRVGRQAYAAMASLRAAAAEPPPQERAHALRRLIAAVRSL